MLARNTSIGPWCQPLYFRNYVRKGWNNAAAMVKGTARIVPVGPRRLRWKLNMEGCTPSVKNPRLAGDFSILVKRYGRRFPLALFYGRMIKWRMLLMKKQVRITALVTAILIMAALISGCSLARTIITETVDEISSGGARPPCLFPAAVSVALPAGHGRHAFFRNGICAARCGRCCRAPLRAGGRSLRV